MLSHQRALYCASAFCLIPARLPSPVLLFLDSPSPSGLPASLSPLASDPLASTLIWLSYSHSAPSLLGTCPNPFQLLHCALITAYDVVLVIYQTRERVFHQDIQTPRSGLKKRGAAEFF